MCLCPFYRRGNGDQRGDGHFFSSHRKPTSNGMLSHCTGSLAPSDDELSIESTCLELLKNSGRHFTKEDIRMAKNHVRRFSTPSVIREMQIKLILYTHSCG